MTNIARIATHSCSTLHTQYIPARTQCSAVGFFYPAHRLYGYQYHECLLLGGDVLCIVYANDGLVQIGNVGMGLFNMYETIT